MNAHCFIYSLLSTWQSKGEHHIHGSVTIQTYWQIRKKIVTDQPHSARNILMRMDHGPSLMLGRKKVCIIHSLLGFSTLALVTFCPPVPQVLVKKPISQPDIAKPVLEDRTVEGCCPLRGQTSQGLGHMNSTPYRFPQEHHPTALTEYMQEESAEFKHFTLPRKQIQTA